MNQKHGNKYRSQSWLGIWAPPTCYAVFLVKRIDAQGQAGTQKLPKFRAC